MDLNYFACFNLNTILLNHVNEFYCCMADKHSLNMEEFRHLSLDERVSRQHELFKAVSHENDAHFALNSRKHELIYLRQTSKKILAFLLPEHMLKCG